MTLALQPLLFTEACEFVRRFHRHHPPSKGWLFGIGANAGAHVVGVITIGRPIPRAYQDGYTCEATRCCTDGTKNACSMLYAAAWRAARAMGYKRLITYTLASEPGTSLRAAGYRVVHQTRAQSWNRPSRPRVDHATPVPKLLWEVSL